MSLGAGRIEVVGFGGDSAGRDAVAAAKTIQRALRCRRLGFSICSVRPGESARLNGRWRGRPRPAEVLSFAFPADEPGGSAGEVYLCLPMVRRRAARLRVPYRKWLRHLATHGMLHLLGFHHSDPEAGRRMAVLERALARGPR